MPQPAAVPPQRSVPAGPSQVSVGGLVGRTFSTWAWNLVPFTILAALVHLPAYLLNLWNTYVVYGTYPSSAQMLERMKELAASGAGPFAQYTPPVIAAWVLLTALTLVEVGALTYGAIQHLAGRPVSFGALLGAGFRRAVPVFFAGLFAGLLAGVASLLLIIPGVIVACAVAVALPAVVAESKGPVAAIRRSFALTKGRRFALFLAFLVVFLAAWTASMLGGVLPFVLGGGAASLLGSLVAFGVGTLVAPLGALLPAVAYHDLRVEKEGVDTATLAEVFE